MQLTLQAFKNFNNLVYSFLNINLLKFVFIKIKMKTNSKNNTLKNLNALAQLLLTIIMQNKKGQMQIFCIHYCVTTL